MSGNFNLRKGAELDFDALFEIYMDESVNRFLNFEIMDKTKFRKIFTDMMHSGDLYVYESDNKIVATCIVTRQNRRAHHVASLGTLATHPAFHRKGIGTRFMNELIEKLKKDGIKRIDLCAEADNPGAHQFYKKLGFQLEGGLKKYFKRPAEEHYVDEYMMAMVFE